MGLTTEHLIDVQVYIHERDEITTDLEAVCSCGWRYEEVDPNILAHAVNSHKIDVIAQRVGLSFGQNAGGAIL